MVTLAVTETVPVWIGVGATALRTPLTNTGVTLAPSWAEMTTPVLAPSPAAMAFAWACACLAASPSACSMTGSGF